MKILQPIRIERALSKASAIVVGAIEKRKIDMAVSDLAEFIGRLKEARIRSIDVITRQNLGFERQD